MRTRSRGARRLRVPKKYSQLPCPARWPRGSRGPHGPKDGSRWRLGQERASRAEADGLARSLLVW